MTSTSSSGSAAVLRLLSDLKHISSGAIEGCSASPHSDDNIFVWTAQVIGPEESAWEGGVFQLRLTFSPDYPDKPPKVRFTTEMFHPNVYADGTLCLDIIQDGWNPCQSAGSLLLSIRSLLTDPNCSSPANPEAARMFIDDQAEYKKRVRRLARRSVE